MPAVWWVNQAEPQHSADLSRGFRWSPSLDRRGRVLEPWRCLEDMVPGDVWVNYKKPRIISLSVVTDPPEPAPRPSDQMDPGWAGDDGYLVRFRDFELDQPIDIGDLSDSWKRSAGPFRSNLWVKLTSVERVRDDAAQQLRATFADRWPSGSPWAQPDAPAQSESGRMRFWLDMHTPATWERFLAGGIDVITMDRPLKAVRPGDVFITFITGDGGRWGSAEEVTSEMRPASSRPYPEYDSKWEWKIRPLTKRLLRDEAIVVRDTVKRLELFRGHEANWGVSVRRSGIEISERDAELIIEWIDAREKGMS